MKNFLIVFSVIALIAVTTAWISSMPPGYEDNPGYGYSIDMEDIEIISIDLSELNFILDNIPYYFVSYHLPCSPGDIFVSELSSDSYIATNNIFELSRISKYEYSVLFISNHYYRSLYNQLNEGLFRLDIGEYTVKI